MRRGRTYGVMWLVVFVSLGLCDIGLFYLVLTFVMRATRGLVARVKEVVFIDYYISTGSCDGVGAVGVSSGGSEVPFGLFCVDDFWVGWEFGHAINVLNF